MRKAFLVLALILISSHLIVPVFSQPLEERVHDLEMDVKCLEENFEWLYYDQIIQLVIPSYSNS